MSPLTADAVSCTHLERNALCNTMSRLATAGSVYASVIFEAVDNSENHHTAQQHLINRLADAADSMAICHVRVLLSLRQPAFQTNATFKCLVWLKRTPGLHNKIPAHKIFARVWVAQKSFFSLVAANIFQGLGPKRRESCNGDRVYSVLLTSSKHVERSLLK